MIFLPPTAHLTWTKQHKPHLRKPPYSCTRRILQESYKLVKLSDISQPPLAVTSTEHTVRTPHWDTVFSVVICHFIIQILIKCPFFSSLYKNCLPWDYNSTRAPNILSGNIRILYLKKGWKTLALSLLRRPSHTKIVTLWETLQEWITLRTNNCRLHTQPKQAIFS